MLDDALKGPVGAFQVGDGPKVGPAEGGLVGLLERRADEQPVLAQLVSEEGQAPFDSTVEVTLRGPLLAPRHDLLRAHGRQRQSGRFEAFSIGALYSFRPLQVHKVLQRRLAEGEQPQLYPGWVAFRLVRHVRPAHIGGRPHGGEQVLHHGPMEHLLARDGENHPAPALDGFELIAGKTGPRRALEAERGVEVLAQQAVLKLSTLAQNVGQLLAVPHHHGRLPAHARQAIASDGRPQRPGHRAGAVGDRGSTTGDGGESAGSPRRCRRHATWIRVRPRSRWRLDHTFKTAA